MDGVIATNRKQRGRGSNLLSSQQQCTDGERNIHKVMWSLQTCGSLQAMNNTRTWDYRSTDRQMYIVFSKHVHFNITYPQSQ